MKKIKIGVIGCGEISQIMHIPFIKEMEDMYELVALCDISKKLLDELSEKYRVKNIFLDYKDMLEMNKLDAVIVATYDHAEIVNNSAKSGIHVFVEKPIAFTSSEAEEMINSCKQNKVKLMVGYMKVFEPSFEQAKKSFQEIDYKLIRVHDYVHYNPLLTKEIYNILKFSDGQFNPMEWLNHLLIDKIGPDLDCADPSLLVPYVFLLMGGVHDIAVLTEIFGFPKKVLFTDIWHHEGEGPEGGKNGLGIFGNYFLSIFEYGKNKQCIFELGGTAKKWMDEEIIAYGIYDTVKFSFGSPYIKNSPAILKRSFMKGNEIHEVSLNTSYEEAFKIELKHFYDCIVNDRNPITNGEKAKKDLELIRDMMKKYLERKEIQLIK